MIKRTRITYVALSVDIVEFLDHGEHAFESPEDLLIRLEELVTSNELSVSDINQYLQDYIA